MVTACPGSTTISPVSRVLEKQVGVIGGDGAVVVQIRRFADGVPETGGVVQNQLGVLGVGDSVTVQVAVTAWIWG